MGILSEKAIRAALADGSLVIQPAPDDEHHFDTDSVEVHISERIYAWKSPGGGAKIVVPLWKADEKDAFNYKEFAKQHLIQLAADNDGIITMRPHTFYLADLKQYVKLPPTLAMHIQGKSTLARLGVMVHLTAPHAHAGWDGVLTLEIYNLGPFNIEIKAGAPFGQLTFWRVENPADAAELREGNFSGQQRATGANT